MEEQRIDWQKLGNRIAEMRMMRGITQMELAERIGVSVTYIGYIEQGKRRATFETCLQIVSFLGYSLNDLMARDLPGVSMHLLASEITEALSDCGEEKQEFILRIVRDLLEMIRLFHSE